MFSLESPHRGDSHQYTQHSIFHIKKKITLYNPKSAAMDFFQWTPKRIRNSRGKRAYSVRTVERIHIQGMVDGLHHGRRSPGSSFG